ncbi:MAG TPA: molybdopterin oxidoreductase, partial [Caulifigura sp.]|nr:molybdopterin oxidoreductase [Caulifigura sp.]
AVRSSLQSAAMRLSKVVVVAGVAKLMFDLLILRALADHRLTSLKRTAKLICGVLSPIATARVGLGILGGVVLPLLAFNVLASSDGGSVAVFATAIPAWAACVGGELLERYLFFAASAAPRMPGAIRS